jgi:uncharacterized protein YbaA (DUF1428 family)
MSYVDGFVLPVPTRNLAKYRRIARLAGKVWREHGALAYVESVGDALVGQPGLPFPKLMKLKEGDSVVFGWVVFESKKHRDQVNALVINDSRLARLDVPFEMKKMTYGGFKVIVEV